MEEQACNDHPCPVTGCTDSAATNFDPQATNDDGSCEYNYGCTDSAATNFDSQATNDDGSCEYRVDCVMGPWGQWGPCSEVCGGGTQTRT